MSDLGRRAGRTSSDTFDKLGIPEAEKKFLAGVGAQYDSEVVYHNIREDLEKLGVIFIGTDQALARAPEDIFKEYFGTIVPPGDNKFAALNSAVWSGGCFIYVPAGVKVDIPLQAYFRINTREHGPVRAHADHRRRGQLRSLRRGLHGADLQHGLAAQRRGRDHRQEGRPRAATRRSRTGRTTSTTSSPSAPPPTRTRSWSGSMATSARS